MNLVIPAEMVTSADGPYKLSNDTFGFCLFMKHGSFTIECTGIQANDDKTLSLTDAEYCYYEEIPMCAVGH